MLAMLRPNYVMCHIVFEVVGASAYGDVVIISEGPATVRTCSDYQGLAVGVRRDITITPPPSHHAMSANMLKICHRTNTRPGSA